MDGDRDAASAHLDYQASPQSGPVRMMSEQLAIGGMRCAACAQLIQFRLQQVSGVAGCQIDLLQQRASVEFDPQRTSVRALTDLINRIGYRALPLARAADLAQFDAEQNKTALWRLFVAGFAMMQVMMMAFPAYLQPLPQIDGDLTPDIDRLLKIASLILTVPVMLFSAKPFFQGAWRDWQNRHIGMDVPIGLGIGLSFAASVWATFAGGPVYFDSVVMFVFLLLGARWLEARMQARATAALRALTRLAPGAVERFRAWPESMDTDAVTADVLRVGDVLRVRPGEQFAVDGVVVAGASQVDESWMTGESRAISKAVDGNVLAGSMNLSGALVVRATEVGSATRMGALLHMMVRAAEHKPPLVQLVDRHASKVLALVLGLSALSALLWSQLDPSRALLIAISVLVVTCPCALSLATPGVMAAALGQMARNGVLMVRGSALEGLARASHVVLDKTGTLTTGRLQVIAAHWWPAQGELAAPLLALAQSSLHPVAQALARHLTANGGNGGFGGNDGTGAAELSEVQEIAGQGVMALWQGEPVRIGRESFVRALAACRTDGVESEKLDERGPNLPDLPCSYRDMDQKAGELWPVQAILQPTISKADRLLAKADTGGTGWGAQLPANASVVWFGTRNGLVAGFALQDQVRPDAAALVNMLQQQGKQVILLSGDRPEVAAQLAAQLGISEVAGGLSAQQKYDRVAALQQAGAVVAMVGDGMNDGPVLSLADVSIAMGQGAPMAQARSDVVLISDRLADLQQAWQIAGTGMRLIRQNLLWALLYNMVAIPAAMAGVLTPWQAALGMSASSLWVVGNALRLVRYRATSPGVPSAGMPAAVPAVASV